MQFIIVINYRLSLMGLINYIVIISVYVTQPNQLTNITNIIELSPCYVMTGTRNLRNYFQTIG